MPNEELNPTDIDTLPTESEAETETDTEAVTKPTESTQEVAFEVADDRPSYQTPYGLIKDQGLVSEIQNSYLDYAMSVIVSRALPDIRDGFKPVHRRVLYTMWQMTGVRPHQRHKKSAAVVGDVMRYFHPHSDTAIYDTLVRLAQDFSMRYPLVNGQGNFGSIDGDPPAAHRYTEAKLAVLANTLMSDIDKETVDFVPNYDGTSTEPQILPAAIPNLLINGQQGIAVGMATSIPPHNLSEVVRAILKLIDQPDSDLDALLTEIKGPDFPTAGVIYADQGLRDAYATGRGKVTIRAVATIHERKQGFSIIISQLPYQVNKSELIERIADLVKLKKVDGITDIRDESDRTEGIRIVIELKAASYPKKVLNRLFELTSLQTTFHFNMLALVDGIQPKTLNLIEILQEFIKHRQIVVRRRTAYLLKKAEERAHILEGIKIALDNIDEVIKVIRGAATRAIAHSELRKKFKLSDIQATAILETRLQTLVALERDKIESELQEKYAAIADYKAILASPQRIDEIVKTELEEILEQYGDERRTEVIGNSVNQFKAEDLIPNEQVFVTLTQDNYIKRVPVETYKSQVRGGKGIIGMDTKEEDVVQHLMTVWTHDDIMFFTDKGRLFVAKAYDLPAASRTSKGSAIVNILPLSSDEKVTAMLPLRSSDKKEFKYIVMATSRGTIKKTEIAAYANVRRNGIIAIKLVPGDALRFIRLSRGKDSVMMVSRDGQAIQFPEVDLRPLGRSATGVRGIKLRLNDELMSMDVVSHAADAKREPDLLVILQNGIGKRTPISNFRDQSRGGVGVRASKVSEKTGKLVEAFVTQGDSGDVLIVSNQGQTIRLPLKSVKRLGRDTQGVSLMRLKPGDKVASLSLVTESTGEETVAEPASSPS